jgi:HTH-type transcriptional regulator/antitoxin MqsA
VAHERRAHPLSAARLDALPAVGLPLPGPQKLGTGGTLNLIKCRMKPRPPAEMQAFSKQVNAAIVDPAFIVKVRKKLSLDQREAAEIFGGGVNAFSRYENGKTRPPLALVKLLKVLDRHPDLLEEVKVA